MAKRKSGPGGNAKDVFGHEDARSLGPRGHWWTWGCLSLGTALATVCPILLPMVWSGISETLWLIGAFTALCIGLLVGIVLIIVNQVHSLRTQAAQEAKRERGVTTFNDALVPFNRALARLLRSKQTEDDLKAFFEGIVSHAPSLLP